MGEMLRRWTGAAATSAAALALALGCGGCSTPEMDYQRTTVDGQDVLAASKPGVMARGVVVFFHGLDRDESILNLDDPHRQLTRELAEAGFPVVASRAGGNAYGSKESQQNYAALTFEAAKHFGVDRVFFIAESMGTVAAVTLMASDKDLPVVGLAAINPLLNLQALPSKYRSAVEYANPGRSIDEMSPLDIPAGSLNGDNLRFYVTPGDRLVPTTDNAAAFEAKFGAIANISIVTCNGEHLDPSCIQGRDIVEWFNSLTPR